MDYKAILTEAHGAAIAATAGLVEDRNAFDCGFAWVTIDGTEPLARYCRKQAGPDGDWSGRRFYGSKGYPKGWQWWTPGNAPVQSMPIHLVGARAFAAVLAKYDIRADVGCRYD